MNEMMIRIRKNATKSQFESRKHKTTHAVINHTNMHGNNTSKTTTNTVHNLPQKKENKTRHTDKSQLITNKNDNTEKHKIFTKNDNNHNTYCLITTKTNNKEEHNKTQ